MKFITGMREVSYSVCKDWTRYKKSGLQRSTGAEKGLVIQHETLLERARALAGEEIYVYASKHPASKSQRNPIIANIPPPSNNALIAGRLILVAPLLLPSSRIG